MADKPKIDHRNFSEIIAFDAATVRFTKDKYLVANPKIARTGIQLYSGDEVGMPSMKVVRVWRPEEEVFHADALHSFAFKPVTNEHPKTAVTADNWKKLSVGQLAGDIAREGESIRIPLALMDAQAINDWKDGKRQLSAGYACDLEWTAGKTPTGEDYDAIQRNIRANHVALVTLGRAGPEFRIGDTDDPNNSTTEDDDIMTDIKLKTITVDGLDVQVGDKDAQIITRFLANQDAKLTTINAELGTLKNSVADLTTKLDAANKTIGTKDAEIETLKKQVTDAALKPEQIDALVRDRAEVVGKAKAILGDALKDPEKLTDADLRKQVVVSKLGDKAKNWNDEQIKVSFDTLTADIKVGTTANTPLAEMAALFSMPSTVGDSQQKTDAAYAKYTEDLQNAYKGHRPGAA